MTKIAQDIGYKGGIAAFLCRSCKSPLLMFGCESEGCDNHWRKNLKLTPSPEEPN